MGERDKIKVKDKIRIVVVGHHRYVGVGLKHGNRQKCNNRGMCTSIRNRISSINSSTGRGAILTG